MNKSRNNVDKEAKIDTHAWNDMGFYCNLIKKSKNSRQLVLQEIKRGIISMTSYEKAKTMFFRTNAEHVDFIPRQQL